MKRRAYLGSLATAAVFASAGCLAGGSGAPGPDAAYDVGMSSTRFEPERVEVTAGDTVVWRNTNSRAHTVTAYEGQIPEGAEYFASGGFDSEQAARDGYLNFEGAIASGETYEHTFTVPGQYDYFCVPHERGGMVGSVVVEE